MFIEKLKHIDVDKLCRRFRGIMVGFKLEPNYLFVEFTQSKENVFSGRWTIEVCSVAFSDFGDCSDNTKRFFECSRYAKCLRLFFI